MAGEFETTGEFDTTGFDFEAITQSHVDDRLLPMLAHQVEWMIGKELTPAMLAAKPTSNIDYHSYRQRIAAFSAVIFPDIVTKNERRSFLATGAIYADALLARGWKKDRRRTRASANINALRFAVGESINLEGSIAAATNPEYVLRDFVDERFYAQDSKYWKVMQRYESNGGGRYAFMLGVGLVCAQAAEVEALRYSGEEHRDAMQVISDAANMSYLERKQYLLRRFYDNFVLWHLTSHQSSPDKQTD